MAGKSRRSKLVLSDEDRMELEQLSRSRTLPHREAQRAAIILGYYGGESIASIGRRLGMTRLSVSKWVAKALAVGPMAALKDGYHRPKEPTIGDAAKAWVVHLACRKPKDLGYAAEVWSRHALAMHVREHALEAGFPALSRAAKATVHRILAEQPLHPEKVKYYLERRDPDFEAGMRRVLIVYQDVALQNERRAAGKSASSIITVSVDEKPGVQAIGNTAPDLPPVPGKHPAIGRDHEYERFGTCFHTGGARSPGWARHRSRGGPSPQRRIHRPVVGPGCKVPATMHDQNHTRQSFRSYLKRDAGISVEAPQPLPVCAHAETWLMAEHR
jgi:transposase